MSKPVTPGWPESGVFPFMPFPLPGATSNPASAAPPLIQGLTGGIDLMKDFWNQFPGAAPLPGFLVPTVDVEELDKRIADLKAAHAWVEVNLNLLRTTIQGLEVQRHTIAAIRALATPLDKPASMDAQSASTLPPGWPTAAATAATTPETVTSPGEPAPAANGAAANWLGYLQDQFAKVAQAAIATGVPAKKPAARRAAAPAKKSKVPTRSSRKPA